MKVYFSSRKVPYEFENCLGIFTTYVKALFYLEKYVKLNPNSWENRFSFELSTINNPLYLTYKRYFDEHPSVIYTDGNETLEIEECELDKEFL